MIILVAQIGLPHRTATTAGWNENRRQPPVNTQKGACMNHIKHTLSAAAMGLILLTAAVSHSVSVGDVAPPFTATSTQGEISLADYKGKNKVVVAFYFAIFTPV